jgi:HK97 family phage portal protein
MGFFHREKRSTEEETPPVNDVLLRAILGSTEMITPDQAMQIPAFASCVNFIAGTISMLPVKLYKQEEDVNGKKIIKEIESDPRCQMLNIDPRDALNATEMKQAWVRDYLLYGSGYIYINRIRNAYRSLNYVRHVDMSCSKNADPIFKVYRINIQGQIYYPHQFLKILRNTADGCHGIGIPEENSQILKVAYNTLIFENLLVSKGGNKKGFLKSQKRLTKDAIDLIREACKKLYSNSEENVVVLNDGLEFQESSNTSVELQLNENKETNRREICSIFKICPAVLSESATDEEYNLTIKMAILPILQEITNTLNRDLLLEKEKSSYFFAFDTAEVMRGDLEKRYSAYKAAVDAGWITKNEIRAKENMVAVDGLDIIGMSLGDVIYDTERKTFFTPNTGTVAGQDGIQKEDIVTNGPETNPPVSDPPGTDPPDDDQPEKDDPGKGDPDDDPAVDKDKKRMEGGTGDAN